MKLLEAPGDIKLVCIKAHGVRTVNKSPCSSLNLRYHNQTFFQIWIGKSTSSLSTIRVKQSGNVKPFPVMKMGLSVATEFVNDIKLNFLFI